MIFRYFQKVIRLCTIKEISIYSEIFIYKTRRGRLAGKSEGFPKWSQAFRKCSQKCKKKHENLHFENIRENLKGSRASNASWAQKKVLWKWWKLAFKFL